MFISIITLNFIKFQPRQTNFISLSEKELIYTLNLYFRIFMIIICTTTLAVRYCWFLHGCRSLGPVGLNPGGKDPGTWNYKATRTFPRY